MADNFRIIILAAGEGKRMGSELPKVLVELDGKPLLLHLLDAVVASKVDPRPIVVVAAGEPGELVRYIAKDYDLEFVEQTEQLGTGHAVQVCQQAVGDASNVMVLYGDHPLLTGPTVQKAADTHLQQNSTITLMTAKVKDFKSWRVGFSQFGRIVRDDQGKVKAIVERKDAAPEQLKIKEVNPAYYCFDSAWLWKNIANLKRDNTQKEYYLTDLLAIAFDQNREIVTVEIEPREALGINSAEQLKLIEGLVV